MSKLDGNERWNSKMLLTEHQEQYDARNTPKSAGKPTPEEFTMIRDYVLLPHMITMVQKSMDEIKNSSNILSKLYLVAAQVLVNRISKDMYALKREMNKRNIKILQDEQIDMVVYHRFSCRGYEDRFGIVREVAKAEISMRLSNYLKDISSMFKENNQ